MRRFFLLVCLWFCSIWVYASPLVSQEMIPLSSAVYGDMDTLYLFQGIGSPSNSRPWSKTEADLILSRIERDRLPAVVRSMYDSVAAEINPGLQFPFDDAFRFGVDAVVNIETYYHNNEEFDLESDWIQGFEQRKPLFKLALDFTLLDFLYIYCDIQYGRNLVNHLDELSSFPAIGVGAVIGPRDEALSQSQEDIEKDILERGWYVTHSELFSQRFLTNVFEHAYDFDFQWPKRAVAAVGGPHWNFSIARDKIEWGNGHSGNFVIDDHVDYHEYARFTAFSKRFKFEWLNVFFETNPSPEEAPDTKFKVLMAHRLEYRLLDWITIAVSENVMYQNTVFDFRYVNPAFVYHNFNNRSMLNAIAHVELDFAFTEGLNVYAQYVMDQARAPYEAAVQADAMGFLAGAEYAVALGPGILQTSLEHVLTSPALYRRDGIDFLMFRKYFNHSATERIGYVVDLDFIGYPYGGDAQVLQWDVSYRIVDLGTIALRVFGMRHGGMDMFEPHNSAGDNVGYVDYVGTTPSGPTVAETLAVSLSGEFGLPGFVQWMEAKLWARVDWVGRHRYEKATGMYSDAESDLQFCAGFSLSL